MKREPIFGVDAIRFFAASAVVLFHLAYKAFAVGDDILRLRIGGDAYIPPTAPISWWGWIGVQIFFVISGLVISYSAAGRKPFAFFSSRVARLLPGMIVCATFMALVEATWGGASLKTVAVLWVKSITFFPVGQFMAGQFWTLGVEIMFYGVVWLMIIFKWVQHLERLAWILAIASGLYWALMGMGWADPVPRLAALLLFQGGCYFALGILLSIADERGMTTQRWLLAGLCVATAWSQIAATLSMEAPSYTSFPSALVPFAIWIAAVACIAASLRWKREIASRLSVKGASYVRAAGLATYPLYLIHMHVGGPIVVEMVRAGANTVLAVAVGLLLSVAASYLVALKLEPPVHRLILAALAWVATVLERWQPKAPGFVEGR